MDQFPALPVPRAAEAQAGLVKDEFPLPDLEALAPDPAGDVPPLEVMPIRRRPRDHAQWVERPQIVVLVKAEGLVEPGLDLLGAHAPEVGGRERETWLLTTRQAALPSPRRHGTMPP